MIKTFRHKGLKLLFEKNDRRLVPAALADEIRRQLDALEAATVVQDLNLPGFGLHPLKGDRKGDWAVTVSRNYRITFSFNRGNAFNVNFEDYH
jgi:toxin HigB-1